MRFEELQNLGPVVATLELPSPDGGDDRRKVSRSFVSFGDAITDIRKTPGFPLVAEWKRLPDGYACTTPNGRTFTVSFPPSLLPKP